jgi:hypothetical protein|tara:strand:+ start:3059 stop:4045 length:987 start_codon:yes stop_codon:yes gene_type:complete
MANALQINLATSPVTYVNKTYAGLLAMPFVAPAILSADSVANGYLSILENVRHKAVLKKFSGGAIADRTCDFTRPLLGTQLVLTDVVLETAQLQVNDEFCNNQLAQDWAAAQMNGADAGMPNAYAAFVSQYVARITQAGVEENIWSGKYDFTDGAVGTGAAQSFEGVLNKYVASAGTHETTNIGAWTAAATPVTATDILLRLAVLVADAPPAIAGDPDANIYMSRASAQLYYTALSNNYNLPFLNDGLVARYAGYNIITPAGFPNDTAIISKKDNMYFGTNVMTDMTEARVLDLTAVTGSAVTRVVLLFDAGCQIVDEASMGCVRRSA